MGATPTLDRFESETGFVLQREGDKVGGLISITEGPVCVFECDGAVVHGNWLEG